MNIQGGGSLNTGKYKTMLCKHFEQTKNCSHRDKCQFAHGTSELRNSSNVILYFNEDIWHGKYDGRGNAKLQSI